MIFLKIVFDIDGTLTDFNKYIHKNAINYFGKKYEMKVVNNNALELEDIFDMNNFFVKKYKCNTKDAEIHTKNALNKYWISFKFVKFSLFGRFRKGVRKYIKQCKKHGYKIEIHTSRAKTTSVGILGRLSRLFTYFQFILNGVFLSHNSFHYYKNDFNKIIGILNSFPDVVFDDKPEILSALNKKNIKTICIKGTHNLNIEESTLLKKADNFDLCLINNILENLLGKNNYTILNKAAMSNLTYKHIRRTIPFINILFHPIILHPENLNYDHGGILIAPNHRSTLDPVVITSIIDKNIHWAALKRFFNEEDSIFNNSKNKLLCKLTSSLFKKLEYFPIERIKDNPKANNIRSIKNMSNFLKNKQVVGIFPEGTTNKSKDKDFGEFDSAFISLAKKNDSFVQAVTILWIKELGIKNKLIVNFSKPFKITDLNKNEAYHKFITLQQSQLCENKLIEKRLIENS